MTTTPESEVLADVQSMDDGFWPWDTDQAIENSEHPLAWCNYCKTWQPAECLRSVASAFGVAPTIHGALRQAQAEPGHPMRLLRECWHHLDQHADHAALRSRAYRLSSGSWWCSYSLTPDELAALREVDWL